MPALLPGNPQIASCILFLYASTYAQAQAPTQTGAVYTAVGSKASDSAPIDGTWEGELQFPAQTLRIVLHISGPINSLSATHDSPDQDSFGHRVDSITFNAPTLGFEITPLKVQFSGNLLSDGTISGTFVQRGRGIPLVLARSAGVVPPASGGVTDGRYHQDQTGIEWDVPAGFKVLSTTNYPGYNGWLTTLGDSENHIFSAWLARHKIMPNRIPAILDGEVPAKIKRRTGLDHYEVPPESVQKTVINGQQAIKATAYFNTGGKRSAELLTWIFTEHTVVHFYAMVQVESLADVQASFDQMVATARVP